MVLPQEQHTRRVKDRRPMRIKTSIIRSILLKAGSRFGDSVGVFIIVNCMNCKIIAHCAKVLEFQKFSKFQ